MTGRHDARSFHSSRFAGTWFLTLFQLKQDWKHLLPWVLLIPVFPASSAVGIKGLETGQGSGLNLSGLIAANPALTMLFGQPGDLDTVDGFVVWRTVLIGSIFAGLMGSFAVTRNIKAPEDQGRAELLASAPIGRFSRLAAGLLVAVVAAVVLGLITWAAATASGGTSFLMCKLGLTYAMSAIFFAALSALAGQILSSGRAANLAVGMSIAVFYMIRIFAEVPNAWPGWRWLTPFGWAELANLGDGSAATNGTKVAMADLSLAPLVVGLIVSVGIVVVSFGIQDRRDFAAGLIQERNGKPHGNPHGSVDSGLAGLVWRLNRSATIGWLLTLAVMGALVGMIFAAIGSTVLSNPAFTQLLNFRGVTLATVELEFARLLLQILALIAALLGIRLAYRFLEEEQATRLETLQALPLARTRTFAHFQVPALIIPAIGFFLGTVAIVAANNANGGHLTWGDALALAAQMLPAMLVLIAVAVCLSGALPAVRWLADLILVATLFISILGPMLNFPDWVMKLSVLEQVPSPLDTAPNYAGVWIICALAAALVALGFFGVRRRNLR